MIRRGDAGDIVDQRSLLERASHGDHEAFGLLVGDQLARLDMAARLILRDPELAQDAVQEATLRAWKNLRGLRDADKWGPWLNRLLVNACLDIARKRRGRAFEVQLSPLPETAVTLGIPVGTAKSRLNRALDAMRITVADENELSAVPTAKERFA